MGAQRIDRQKPNYDPHAKNNEGPIHSVTLAPFFLSKYELTQGQYERLMGSNPSYDRVGETTIDGPVTLAHPVENMSFDLAEALGHRIGFEVPTEAQWEYAARGGTMTPWAVVNERTSLALAANLADETWRLDVNTKGLTHEPWNDGTGHHAPVGSYTPSPFGLYDVIGNVWEWTRDSMVSYTNPVNPVDGARHGQGDGMFVLRGGAYCDPSERARVALRIPNAPASQMSIIGLRLSKPIE